MMCVFSIIFGVIYAGYSFPSLRAKESSISYITLPASVLEKFLLEFINRVLLAVILLPLLFWLTYNVGTYFLDLVFRKFQYEFVGPAILREELADLLNDPVAMMLIVAVFFLALILPFTGAAFFVKQPLIKTLFSVASIVILYILMIYVVVDPLGLKNYIVPDDVKLLPVKKEEALLFFTIAVSVTNLIMLVVAYLKLKEKEV